jgi:hypothetical protein
LAAALERFIVCARTFDGAAMSACVPRAERLHHPSRFSIMMMKFRTAGFIALAALAVAATAALAGSTVRMIAGGKPHTVRAIEVGGAWYVSAEDVARALGNGASFDSGSRTLLASTADRYSLMHTVDHAGGGFATDGTIAARLVSVKTVKSFQGNAPDPGAHFVMATIQLKNLTDVGLPLDQVETSLVAGGTHLGDGQFYDANGNDLQLSNATPGQTVTYLDVFEINDDVAADAILVHPPFAPKSVPADMLLKLKP